MGANFVFYGEEITLSGPENSVTYRISTYNDMKKRGRIETVDLTEEIPINDNTHESTNDSSIETIDLTDDSNETSNPINSTIISSTMELTHDEDSEFICTNFLEHSPLSPR